MRECVCKLLFLFWIVLYLYHRMNKIGLKNAGVRVQLQTAASPDLDYLLFTSYFPRRLI